jgi:anti-sigma regulatory factor (Ser/Thr protein kinase)
MTLELHATPGEVMRAVEAFQEFARDRQVPDKTVFGLALALEECASNVVNHALKGDAQATFRVAVALSGDTLAIELRDPGPAFDPTVAAACKPQADDDDLPGGWGIHLARRYTDEMSYAREGGENVLRLARRFGPACDPKPNC